jgi:hypothetical protein
MSVMVGQQFERKNKMGFIRRPEPVKIEDADAPIEENVVCIVNESTDGNSVEIICVPEELIIEDKPVEEVKAEIKPKAVITSTATGEQFGNWIPSLRSSGNIDINIRNALYTKSGQLVTCTFDIIVTNIAERNSSSITLNDLPVVSISSPGISGSAHFSYFKTATNELTQICGTINGNESRIDLWCERHGRKGLQRLTQQDIQPNTVLVGTVTYITNS